MDYCENCKSELEIVDFYQAPVIFDEFFQRWHYKCSKCGKKYAYTEYFRMVHTDIQEE